MTKTLPIDDGGHSKLAPSSASRWTVCTASPAFIEANQDRIPKDNGSAYADEGTLAHDWAKKILLGESEITDLPEDLVEPVGFYLNHCRRIEESNGGTKFVERQVPLFYRPQDNGTVDFALLTAKALRFRDYKHGEGVTVEAKGNKQLAIYAFSLITDLEEMGLWEFPDEMLVDMGIVQPRCREGEPIKLWAITVKELRDFCIEIRTAANLIRYAEEGMNGAEDKLHFVPVEGDAGSCRWCPAKGFCKARAEKLQEPIPFDVVGAFEDLDEGQTIAKDKAPAPEQLTDEEIAALVLATPDLVKWLNDVKEYACLLYTSDAADE